jgi:hypothetical protein
VRVALRRGTVDVSRLVERRKKLMRRRDAFAGKVGRSIDGVTHSGARDLTHRRVEEWHSHRHRDGRRRSQS